MTNEELCESAIRLSNYQEGIAYLQSALEEYETLLVKVSNAEYLGLLKSGTTMNFITESDRAAIPSATLLSSLNRSIRDSIKSVGLNSHTSHVIIEET